MVPVCMGLKRELNIDDIERILDHSSTKDSGEEGNSKGMAVAMALEKWSEMYP